MSLDKRAYAKQYYADNAEKLRAYQRGRPKNPAARRQTNLRYSLKRRYRMSLQEFEAVRLAQNGLCAICKRASERHLCIDHCHSTGRVRGLLCITCNAGLGMFRDDTGTMQAAISYLTGAL